jgi:L-arabinonolactonase
MGSTVRPYAPDETIAGRTGERRMKDVEVRCVVDAGCLLGEWPVWDVETHALWWVDIKAPAIHRWRPDKGTHHTWPAPSVVGALALRAKGGLVLALKSGLAFYDPDRGALRTVAAPEANVPGNRMNDGKCDALGRFWVGTMHDAETEATGHLYRLDADHSVTRFDAGFVVTNGMGWSGDGRTMYFTDSAERTIWAYDFDMAAGLLGARRLFARVPEADGYPDGLTVDAEDHVWSCHWAGSRVTRYRPDGTVERSVTIPAPLVTSCCFGGERLDCLYVTTATISLDADARRAAPHAGAVFAVKGLGVSGRPMMRYAG